MVYGYARVSTLGQSLDEQIRLLEEAGATEIYSEKESAKSADRQELKKLLELVKEGDLIVVTRIDRLHRSTEDALMLLNTLCEKGVSVKVLDIAGETLDTSSRMGKMNVTMLLAFAEFERDLIKERMAEGKLIAKRDPNWREGRKQTYTKEQILHAHELKQSMSYKQVYEKTGISPTTLKRRVKDLKDRGVIQE